MKPISHFGAFALCGAIALALAGCGGGGGTTDPDPAPEDGDSISITGKAVDGYLRYSTVCLDLNKDGYCQFDSEPFGQTDAQGGYSLSITADHQAHENYRTAKLVVFGGQDSDTNQDFNHKLMAPFQANGSSATIHVTPLTTMVAAILDEEGGVTGDNAATKIAAAKTKAASALGLSETDIVSDPVAVAASKPEVLNAALQVQKAVEVLATATGGSDSKARAENAFKALAAAAATTTSGSVANRVASLISNVPNERLTGGGADTTKANAATIAAHVNAAITAATDSGTLATASIQQVALIVDETVQQAVAGEPITDLQDLNMTEKLSRSWQQMVVESFLDRLNSTEGSNYNSSNAESITVDLGSAVVAGMTWSAFESALENKGGYDDIVDNIKKRQIRSALRGQTFYVSHNDGWHTVIILTFNEDATLASVRDDEGFFENVSVTVTTDGFTLAESGEFGPETLSNFTTTNSSVYPYTVSAGNTDNLRLYQARLEAHKYMGSFEFFSGLVAGKTLYIVSGDADSYGTVKFSSDGTKITSWMSSNGEGSDNLNVELTFNHDGEMTFSGIGEGDHTMKIIGSHADYYTISWTEGDWSGSSRIYFDQTKAANYVTSQTGADDETDGGTESPATVLTQSFVAGKTYYVVNPEDASTGVHIFSTNGQTVKSSEYNTLLDFGYKTTAAKGQADATVANVSNGLNGIKMAPDPDSPELILVLAGTGSNYLTVDYYMDSERVATIKWYETAAAALAAAEALTGFEKISFSGTITYSGMTVPNDAGIRILSEYDANEYDYDSALEGPISGNSFNFTHLAPIGHRFSAGETFQIVVYKDANANMQWDCGEDAYKQADEQDYGRWSDITVILTDYVDHSSDSCSDEDGGSGLKSVIVEKTFDPMPLTIPELEAHPWYIYAYDTTGNYECRAKATFQNDIAEIVFDWTDGETGEAGTKTVAWDKKTFITAKNSDYYEGLSWEDGRYVAIRWYINYDALVALKPNCAKYIPE